MYTQRGENPAVSPFQGFGKFGRIFPDLYPLHSDENALRKLGAKGGPMEETNPDHPAGDSKSIDAGFIFFGQFVDHDITLDVTSSLEGQNDPEAIWNFRTPYLELDSVYGQGPEAQPYLYDGDKLIVFPGDATRPQDLQRNGAGRAIIGDPRNDENVLLAQLQLAFILFHNAVVDKLSGKVADEDLFREAQRLVRWHYQYVVVNELLPLVCGKKIVDDVLKNGRCIYRPEDSYHYSGDPFMPVEFAVGAYRYGHSQVRQTFRLNKKTESTLFGLLGSAFRPLKPGEKVDWRYFFKIDKTKPQAARKIDGKLPASILDLPFIPAGGEKSLASRNLLRGRSFCLPSGQAVARFLCGRCNHAPQVLGQDDLGLKGSGLREAPLWFYVLKEAEIVENGEHLGPLGGRIVAETLLGLLQLDRMSYLHLDPCWEPDYRKAGKFGMKELLQLAGVA
jgi:hypothetical protein